MNLSEQTAHTFPLRALEGRKRILLYPAASGSEYLTDFFRDQRPDLLERLVGLGDKDPNKHGLRQNGLRVYPPSALADLAPDAVLITSPALFPAMSRDLRALLGPDTPLYRADDLEEYLAWEARRSALARRMADQPFEPDRNGPDAGDWYLCMPLGGGRYARSFKGALTFRMLEQIDLPRDLTGASVLDLASSDGFYGFECEARGASEVICVEGPGWETGPGFSRFDFARALYGSSARHAVGRVEEFPDQVGRSFDLVLSLGIYYHLQDPLGYFRKLKRITADTLIVTGRTVALTAHDPINTPYDQTHMADPSVFTGRAASIMLLSDKTLGKWTANTACLTDMLRIVGFRDVEVVYDHCPAGSFVASTAVRARV